MPLPWCFPTKLRPAWHGENGRRVQGRVNEREARGCDKRGTAEDQRADAGRQPSVLMEVTIVVLMVVTAGGMIKFEKFNGRLSP